MYLFTRQATLGGNPRAAMGWAAEMTAYVSARSNGHPVLLWSVGFGRPVGTVVWTTWVESHADLQAAFAGLLEDDGYYDLIDKGQAFNAGANMADSFNEAIHGGPTGATPPIGSVAVVSRAVMNVGKAAEAMAFGVDIASYVESVTGSPTAFLASSYGTFGEVMWISGAPDMAANDAAAAAINGDAGWLERIGRSNDLFLSGSGHRSLATRIA